MALSEVTGECIRCLKPIAWHVYSIYENYRYDDIELPESAKINLLGTVLFCGKCGAGNILKHYNMKDTLRIEEYVIPTAGDSTQPKD